MNNRETILVAGNVHKSFRQGRSTVHAVNGVDISVSKGERVFIHGPSGAGKSTFLDILGGLSRPEKGKVVFNGMELYRISDRKLSRVRNVHFGFIFQFYHLLPELNVLENVMLPGRIKRGYRTRDVKKNAVDLLERVGLTARTKHRPGQLSGGESQRAVIARALINSPDIVFCDEPTGNLDSELSGHILKLLYELSEETGTSLVMVSHQDIPDGYFHNEYFMKDGVFTEKELIENLQNQL